MNAPSIAIQSNITTDMQQPFLRFLDAGERTTETYKRALRQFFLFLINENIKQPTREDILAYRESLKLRDLKPATIQLYITAVRLFFQWTEAEGLYPDISRHVKGARSTKQHKKDALTATQARAVLDGIRRETIRGRRNYALCALMMQGGLRDIEIRRANIADLRILGGASVLLIQGKGREERSEFVKIMPEVERAIRAMLADRPGSAGTDPLFVSLSNNSKGGRLTTRSISGIVKAQLVRSGFNSDRLTAHSLRHTAVTLALMGGATLQEAQQLARHSDINTTQIYAHNLERLSNRSEEIIAKAIFSE